MLLSAIEDVKMNGLSLNKAAKKWNIPKGTLFNKVNGKSSLVRKMGPDTKLPQYIEEALAKWIIGKARIG